MVIPEVITSVDWMTNQTTCYHKKNPIVKPVTNESSNRLL